MNDSIKKHKQENEFVKAKTDSKAELIEPIDFSFKDLMVFEEINENHPRHPPNKQPKKIDEKYASLGLKLGYNALKDIVGIHEWCITSFAFPDQISTIDLSFNCLSTVPIELLKFPGLKTVYMHGNKISDLTEVDKLTKLKNLTAFTIHGNPVETLVGFRQYILNKLPGLKHLNFCGISKADRQTAITWVKSNNKPLKVESKTEEKPKKKTDED